MHGSRIDMATYATLLSLAKLLGGSPDVVRVDRVPRITEKLTFMANACRLKERCEHYKLPKTQQCNPALFNSMLQRNTENQVHPASVNRALSSLHNSGANLLTPKHQRMQAHLIICLLLFFFALPDRRSFASCIPGHFHKPREEGSTI